jgi:FAD/FMN-containing dehydrogenase
MWIKPQDEQYDEQRSLFNAMIDKRPRLIAACTTPADVSTALERARSDDLEVAVRAGGHSVAGMSTNDDGLVIDVRPMKSIEVDPQAGRVRVGAGVTWGELDRATQEHGLATTGGRVSSTGVAGFTLGGGSGWLERKYGLACDNLLAVELVTADGRQVRADATQHQELFWALHGGGGNFGVATAFELALHPVGPEIAAGLTAWRADAAESIAHAFREWAKDAADELSAWFMLLTAPDEDPFPEELRGQRIALVAAMWCGDVGEGMEAFAPIRALEPDLDLMGPMQYCDLQSVLDDVPGNRHYWSADYHPSLPDEALAVLLRSGATAPSPLTQQIVLPWGGAVARVPEGDTPMTQRDAAWVSHPFAVWEDSRDDAANIEWVRSFRREIAPYTTGGVYLNFIGDEGESRIRDAYGAEKYQRLSRVKAEYDPENVFRGNQNIQPARSVSSPG